VAAIFALAGGSFEARVDGFPTGLVGVLGVRTSKSPLSLNDARHQNATVSPLVARSTGARRSGKDQAFSP
jgi:hypothetical protein